MLWIIIIGIIAAALYFSLRKSRQTEHNYEQWNTPGGAGRGYMTGAGMLAGGMMLGYLLNNNLISHEQYDDWQNMNSDELKQTLADNGIVSGAEFDSLAGQFETQNAMSDYGSDFDSQDYGDSSGMDDSGFDGGFDDF